MNTSSRVALFTLLGFFTLTYTLTGHGRSLQQQHLVHNGTERTYALYAPERIGTAELRPLVIVLHGGGGDAENAAYMTGFSRMALRERFFVAYPNGSSRLADALQTWNVRHCCGYARKSQVDDVGFIRLLIDTLVKQYPVDPQRIYVTGMSNGGMLTHRIGIELGDKVAAIAPVVATLFGDEAQPANAVPTLIINGALDKSVPPAGGAPGGRASFAWDGTPTQPAAYQAAFWAQANGCNPEAQMDSTGSSTAAVTRWRYDCPHGHSVVRYLIGDNGHAWPGGKAGSRRGDTPSDTFDATAVIWEFFAAHAR